MKQGDHGAQLGRLLVPLPCDYANDLLFFRMIFNASEVHNLQEI